MAKKIVLVVPEAPLPAVTAAKEQRKIGNGGLRLGILDNSKGNADHLLNFVVDGVQKQVAIASVVKLRKSSVSLPAPKEILDRLTAEADLVVSAMAD